MSDLTNLTESISIPVIGTIVLPQAEYEAFIEYEGEFDVVCFQVNYNHGRLINDPLSPLLETREQAQAFLAEIKKTVPTAKMGKHMFYYSSADDRDRKEILRQIVKAGGES